MWKGERCGVFGGEVVCVVEGGVCVIRGGTFTERRCFLLRVSAGTYAYVYTRAVSRALRMKQTT